MFDVGFLELLLCGVIGLLVLGPERLPVAARSVGRWVGRARRMTRQFTEELDRQLKADELREKIRKEGSAMGADEIKRNYRQGLDEARKYTDYLASDGETAVTPSRGRAAPHEAVDSDVEPPFPAPAADTATPAQSTPVENASPEAPREERDQEPPHR